jgi:hypothetical protein
MKNLLISFALIGILMAGCEKDDTSVTPTPASSNVFTTSNIKTKPVYFSFASKDSVAATAAWDLKLTTVFAPDDSLRQFPSPGIVLNSALNVTGTYVDVKYESVDPAAVSGLTKDALDSLVIDSTRSVKSMPVYYSFDKRDTTAADGNWDVKLTVNAAMEPLIVLNKAKGVTGKTLDATPFSTYNAAQTALESDVNDTTLVIGNKCFLYAGPPTHRLNPIANRTFVVRTINGARVKFQTLSYYNAAGSSGYMKFQYAAPERYSIGSFCLKYAGPPTHKLNPYTDRTFVVKTSAGSFAKFKLLTYYNEANVSGFMKFEYAVK